MNSVYALIGGSNYSGSWTVYQSRQDALHFAQYMANIGVNNQHVMILLDNQYTRKNVLRELHSIARNIPSGSTAILYFAGHGTQVRDTDYRPVGKQRDEEDGLDEALQTHDHRVVTDDDLSYDFVLAADNHRDDPNWSIKVITIADTCHSPSLDMWRFENTAVKVISIKAALDSQSALQSGDGSYMSHYLFKILESDKHITVRNLEKELSKQMREGFAGTMQLSKIEVSDPTLWDEPLL